MDWNTIGFDKNKKLFEASLKNGLLGHAYLFSGQEMIGKKTFAIELAGDITGGYTANNPDILLIDPASSDSGQTITIEEVRKIKNFVSLSSYASKHKFVIIDDAHLMTTEAQNALLKVLEEPSGASILILVTSYPDALLPTIVSRCQELGFSPHGARLLEKVLAGSQLSKPSREFLAEFANGRIGLIKRIIAEDSFGQVEAAVKKIMDLSKMDINDRLKIAQKMTDEKDKTVLPQQVLYWTLYLRTRLNEPKARKILRNILALYETVRQPQFNQRLALESFLIFL